MSDQKDNAGQVYISPDNKPAGNGTTVTVPDGSGRIGNGTMIGGTVVRN
jgi:hypothetical protein